MKVIKNLSVEILGTNTHYFNLNELSDENSDEWARGINHIDLNNVPRWHWDINTLQDLQIVERLGGLE